VGLLDGPRALGLLLRFAWQTLPSPRYHHTIFLASPARRAMGRAYPGYTYLILSARGTTRAHYRATRCRRCAAHFTHYRRATATPRTTPLHARTHRLPRCWNALRATRHAKAVRVISLRHSAPQNVKRHCARLCLLRAAHKRTATFFRRAARRNPAWHWRPGTPRFHSPLTTAYYQLPACRTTTLPTTLSCMRPCYATYLAPPTRTAPSGLYQA